MFFFVGNIVNGVGFRPFWLKLLGVGPGKPSFQ